MSTEKGTPSADVNNLDRNDISGVVTQGQDEGGDEERREDNKDSEDLMQARGEGGDKDKQEDKKDTRGNTVPVEARSNMKKAQERLDDHTIQRFLKETKENPHLNESRYVKLAMEEIKSRNQSQHFIPK